MYIQHEYHPYPQFSDSTSFTLSQFLNSLYMDARIIVAICFGYYNYGHHCSMHQSLICLSISLT